MTISVVLVDDQALVRTGFAMILDAQPDIEVVGEASDGVQAVATTCQLRPDVVLMDVQMPKMDGLEATGRIVQQADIDSRVVILTTFEQMTTRSKRCGPGQRHPAQERHWATRRDAPPRVSRTLTGTKRDAQRLAASLQSRPAPRAADRSVADVLVVRVELNEATWATASGRDQSGRVQRVLAHRRAMRSAGRWT
jgi:chemotaxis response regulator CheB